ncbi:MAG: hypothetical protein JXR91_11555 [Deltaproteobacteria bacterium]|nr:hypothetical protein [Deltaproteobacteria bacterium]
MSEWSFARSVLIFIIVIMIFTACGKPLETKRAIDSSMDVDSSVNDTDENGKKLPVQSVIVSKKDKLFAGGNILDRIAGQGKPSVNADSLNKENLKFTVCKNQLCIKYKDLRLKLGPTATSVNGLGFTDGTFKITYSCNYCCDTNRRTSRWSAAELAARIENYLALEHHLAKRYKTAASGFAAALKNNDSFETARTNLACALAKSGKTDDAVKVLQDEKGVISIPRFFKIFSDADLEPLRTHPAVKAMYSKTGGDVPLSLYKGGLRDFGVIYSKEYNLIGLISTYSSWAVDMHEDYLDLFDAATGERLLREFLGTFIFEEGILEKKSKAVQKAEDAELQKHLGNIEAILNRLGFKVVEKKDIHRAITQGMGQPPIFPKEKMALTNSPDGLILLKDRRPYRQFKDIYVAGYWQEDTAYLPGLDTFVVETHGDEPEGCSTDAVMNLSYVIPVALGEPISSEYVKNSNTPEGLPGEKPAERIIKQIFSGNNHHCVLRKNGNMICFGINDSAAMGDPSSYYKDLVYQSYESSNRVQLYYPLNMTNIRTMAVGEQNSCAVKKDGTVWCWGYSYWWPELDKNMLTSPVQIESLTNIVAIGGRKNSYCVVKENGTILCWGKLIYSDSKSNRRPIKTISSLKNIKSVALSGDWAACAVNTGGEVWCWGYNNMGRLGDGTTEHRKTPVRVKNIKDITQVTMGESHSCALTDKGVVWCWGDNRYGQVTSEKSVREHLVPALHNLPKPAISLTAGESHTCAILSDHTLQCWGEITLDEEKALKDVVAVGAEYRHTCAVKTDGTVWCWGNNRIGQFIPYGPEQFDNPRQVTGLR